MSEFTIESYADDIAESLAQMWNESDGQWPGTFTRGVPMTGERITKWMSEADYMMNLVVKRDDGKIVAYGNLRDTPNQTGVSCYVPLLNVHPEFQGKSLCRRMLNRMVDHATEHGYQRMTIGTWSGNLKSVPLYKKVGFFWTPGIAVHMENYIPAVRQLPFARRFFANADWYTDFSRELKQAEDKMRHPLTGSMQVYICRWQKDGDFIEAIIDREGQSITGVETAGFAAIAVVDDSNPAQGFRYGISWCLHNRLDVPLTVALQAEADEGIDIDYRKTITLAPGEKRRLESSFICTVDAPAIDFDEQWEALPRPRIHTHLTVGNESFTLATGLAYRPAVEISTEPDVVSLLPGQEKKVLVQLKNRVKRPFTGTLTIQANEHIQTDWESCPFDIDSAGFTAVPLTIRSRQAGGHLLKLSARLPDGAEQVETTPVETAVLCTPLGSVAAVELADKLLIENDFFLATAANKAGRVKLWDKISHKEHVFFREEVGPPFNPRDLEQKQYDLSLRHKNGQVLVNFQVTSDRFPGLRLSRDVLFSPSPIIQLSHKLTNGGHEPVTLTVMTRMGMNNTNHGNGRSTIPRPEGIVSDITSLFPIHDDDFPQESDEISEQWAAYEVDGQIHGIVWANAGKHKLRWGMIDLHSPALTLAPGETAVLDPIYPFCGSGTWADVRRVWQRVTNQSQAHTTPEAPYALTLHPSPVFTLADTVDVTLQASNVRKLALKGNVTLAMPSGWSANRTRFCIDNLTQSETFAEPVTLTAPPAPGPAAAHLHLDAPATDEAYAIPLIRLGNNGTEP